MKIILGVEGCAAQSCHSEFKLTPRPREISQTNQDLSLNRSCQTENREVSLVIINKEMLAEAIHEWLWSARYRQKNRSSRTEPILEIYKKKNL